MKVRAVKGFSGVDGGRRFTFSEGQVFELPEGADWLRAGLVEPVDAPETTMLPPAKPKKVGHGRLPVAHLDEVQGHEDELEALGVKTIADLAAADVSELTSIKGVGKVTAGRWIRTAQERLT